MIEGHGDDAYKYQGKIIHNFSSNVYYKGCPPELLASLLLASKTIQSYPSPDANELSEAASRKFDLPSTNFLFTNGATEAFYLIAHAFSRKKAAILAPTFSEYEDACRSHGVDYKLVDSYSLVHQDFELVFICNPNNPDGSTIPLTKLIQMFQVSPATMFVIDEAYIEFTDQTSTSIPYIKHLPNLIVVRSLTKSFAVPGVRLGYTVATASAIEQLLSKKMPWSVNALAIQAGLQIFQNYDDWLFDVNELLAETNAFIRELSVIDWLEIQPTNTTYFLAKLNKGTASELKDFLAIHHGILIRDATNFKGLTGEYIRIATQSSEANAALIEAFKKWD